MRRGDKKNSTERTERRRRWVETPGGRRDARMEKKDRGKSGREGKIEKEGGKRRQGEE